MQELRLSRVPERFSEIMMPHRYRLLFFQPGVVPLAVFGLISRLPNGMLQLAFVLTLIQATGSYAMAGAAVTCYTLAAAIVFSPWTRAVDRVGPRTVLVITGLVQGLVLLVVTVVSMLSTNGVLLMVLAGASGVFVPPVGSIMRSLWSTTLTDKEIKDAAFAYESIVVEVVFLVGPTVVAAVSALSQPSWALAFAALATTGGCLSLAGSSRVRALTGNCGSERHWLGPLRHLSVLVLLPIGLLLMGSITAIEVSLVSFATHRGGTSVSGLLIAILSLGSVVGGTWWGSRSQPGTSPQQLAVLLEVLGIGWAVLTVSGNPWLLGGLLLLAGLALNPAITTMFSIMDDIATRDTLTESFGWLNALGSAGAAAGASITGAVVESGANSGFLFAASMCATGGVIALLCQPLWRREISDVPKLSAEVIQ
ncbi:MAG: MFS transporter [Pseudonocardiaceae bacterium]